MSNHIIDIMCQYGIPPQNEINIIHDGRIHRYKAIHDNGWYVAFPNGGGLIGHWSQYGEQFFTFKGVHNKFPDKADISRIKKELKMEKQKLAKQAREKAEYIIKNSLSARADHPYLEKKQIMLNALKCHNDSLIISMYRNHLELNSLQLIYINGEKRFLKGTAKKGCYSLIGHHNYNHPIIIAEGFATAASIYQSLDIPIFISFDCGNFKSALETICQYFTFNGHIIVAADNDASQVSYKHAREALADILAIKRHIIMPGTINTDWNDAYVVHGRSVIKKTFMKVLS